MRVLAALGPRLDPARADDVALRLVDLSYDAALPEEAALLRSAGQSVAKLADRVKSLMASRAARLKVASHPEPHSPAIAGTFTIVSDVWPSTEARYGALHAREQEQTEQLQRRMRSEQEQRRAMFERLEASRRVAAQESERLPLWRR